MSTREQRTRRVLALQEQLHRVAHWKLLDLRRRVAELDSQRRELIAALNDSDALQGLFLDATARRLMSIAREADEVGREERLQIARVREHAVRLACAERLSEAVAGQAARADEKRALREVIDRLVGAATPASRKIAPP
ncbi:MAG TPA: hypothetical protein VE258_19825 [Ktedonobacterales bacterium]|nr:hypothetical protein [Ktedonobacterales bacterium]